MYAIELKRLLVTSAVLVLFASGTVIASENVLSGVPGYPWYHGSGPTSGMMLSGYWDANGFPQLIPGSNDWSSNQSDSKDTWGTVWQVGTGDWDDPASWDSGIPDAEAVASVPTGGTATISGGSPDDDELPVAAEALTLNVQGTVHLAGGVYGGSLTAGTMEVGVAGAGEFRWTGGALDVDTANVNQGGTMSIETDSDWVSDGAVNIDGGTVNSVSGGLIVDGPGIGATATLGGTGQLTAPRVHVGYYHEGSFTQTGGVHTVANDDDVAPLVLGRTPASTGSYEISAGNLNVQDGGGTQTGDGEIILGYKGEGVLTIQGGQVLADRMTLALRPGSSGSVEMSDGTLDIDGSIQIGREGAGQFNLSGGLVIADEISIGSNGKFSGAGPGSVGGNVAIPNLNEIVLSKDAKAGIEIGNWVLYEDTSDQTVLISVTGGDPVEQVAGMNFRVQIGDGGPELGGSIDGPEFTGGDLVTGTIFAGDLSAGGTVLRPQFFLGTAALPGSTVAADGLLAALTISTEGFFAVNDHNPWALKVTDLVAGADEIELLDNSVPTPQPIPLNFVNGTITLVPRPPASGELNWTGGILETNGMNIGPDGRLDIGVSNAVISAPVVNNGTINVPAGTTLTFSGAVSGSGTLQVDGTLTAASVTYHGTLSGTGTIVGEVWADGIVAPGTDTAKGGIGTLTFDTGDPTEKWVEFGSAAEVNMDIGATNDVIVMHQGVLDLGGSQLNLNVVGDILPAAAKRSYGAKTVNIVSTNVDDSSIDGVFSTALLPGEHLGRGIFVDVEGNGVVTTTISVKVDLYQAQKGDANGDHVIDTGDMMLVFGNWTLLPPPDHVPRDWPEGNFSFFPPEDANTTIETGDMMEVFGNWTLEDAGDAKDGDPQIADLLYYPATGDVKLDPSEAAGEVITIFRLMNDPGEPDFNAPGEANFPWPLPDFLAVDTPLEIANTDLSGSGISDVWSLGAIFPTGLDQDQLEAFLTVATYVGSRGTGVHRLDLIVIPEPGTVVMLLTGALGLLLLATQRRRRTA